LKKAGLWSCLFHIGEAMGIRVAAPRKSSLLWNQDLYLCDALPGAAKECALS